MDNEVINKKLPVSLSKIVTIFESFKEKVETQKNTIDDLNREIKSFEKLLLKYVNKYTNEEIKEKKPRKKSGFALPLQVTDELCEFMGVVRGTKIARTEVTKYLNIYIREKNLKDLEKKSIIVPDETLWKILGEEARDKEITHFTIQKYINKHFVTSKKNNT
jgi:chromatin remodeling complex protein RSC6